MNTSRISIAFLINKVLPFLVALSFSQTVGAITVGGKSATARPQAGNPKLFFISQEAYAEEVMTREQLDRAMSPKVDEPKQSVDFSKPEAELTRLREEYNFLDEQLTKERVQYQKDRKDLVDLIAELSYHVAKEYAEIEVTSHILSEKAANEESLLRRLEELKANLAA